MKKSTILQYLLFGLIIVVFGITCFKLGNAHTQEINNIRFQSKMHDTAGQLYSVYLFSNDETSEITKDMWAGADKGDKMYSGHYQLALAPDGAQSITVQSNPLKSKGKDGLLKFNANRQSIYVIRSQYPNQPDILIIKQYGTSSCSDVYAYYIHNGAIQCLLWDDGAQKRDDHTMTLSREPIFAESSMQYHARFYSNTTASFVHSKWQLDIPSDSFKLLEHWEVPLKQEKQLN